MPDHVALAVPTAERPDAVANLALEDGAGHLATRYPAGRDGWAGRDGGGGVDPRAEDTEAAVVDHRSGRCGLAAGDAGCHDVDDDGDRDLQSGGLHDASAGALVAWRSVARPGDEVVTGAEVRRRLSIFDIAYRRLARTSAFVRVVAEDGVQGLLWRSGSTRQSVLDDWLARNSPMVTDEAFDEYRDVLKGLGFRSHAPGVPRQAYDFLRGEGAAVNEDELVGTIGNAVECKSFLLGKRRAEGRFIPLRHSSGGPQVAPTQTVGDVLRRLDLHMCAEGTAVDERLMDDFATLTSYQCRALLALGNDSLFASVALYLMNKLMDDVHPAVVDDVLILAARLDVTLDGAHVGKADEMTDALNRYVVEKSTLPDDSDSRRADAVYLLYAVYETLGDWIDLLKDPKARDYFSRFQVALPRRSHKYIRILKSLERRAGQVAFSTRKGRSDRLVAGYDRTRYAVEVRHAQMRRMHDAYGEACARLRAMGEEEREAALPYAFFYRESVPAIDGAPATDQFVLLQVETRGRVVRALVGRGPDESVRQRVPGGSDYQPAAENDYLLEYVDTRPVVPGGATRPLWLVDVARSWFFCPPGMLNPADKRRRRAMMRKMRMGPAAAKDARQFFGFGNKSLNGDVYRAWATLGRFFLPVKGMMACSLVSRVFIRVMSTNGARPSEVMMMQTAEERWGEVYDLENRVHVTYFEAVPKGKDDWAVFFIDEDTRKAVDELLEFVVWRWYDGAPPPVMAHARNLHRKQLHGQPLPDARLILSWAGKAVDHSEFSVAMKTMFLGLGDWLPYDLRHAFAAVARAERMPKDVLMKVMHHEREEQSDHYSDPTAQAKAAFLTRFSLRRSLVADLIARGEDGLEEEELEALKTIGVLGKTPGGQCMNSLPCHDATACLGCAFNRADPACRAEVLEMRAHAREALDRAEAGGFGRYVDQSRRDVADVEAQLREMDLVELARDQAAARPEVVAGAPVTELA